MTSNGLCDLPLRRQGRRDDGCSECENDGDLAGATLGAPRLDGFRPMGQLKSSKNGHDPMSAAKIKRNRLTTIMVRSSLRELRCLDTMATVLLDTRPRLQTLDTSTKQGESSFRSVLGQLLSARADVALIRMCPVAMDRGS